MKSSSRSSKRKPKRSQKHSKKKSKIKKEKIKKLKLRDYSVSCSDDEDSLSCSSRGDGGGGGGGRGKKRGRSSDRKKSRRGKKRSKKISLVNESSGDDYSRVKRSKRSKKDRSLDGKKKRRRERSVSSVSSGRRSGSCSEWSDDCEGDIEREDEMVEMKERKGREKRSGSKRSRRRSRSSSSCSLRSGVVSTPKRLKSVIVVMKERDVVDERELVRDDRREDEIVCEFDDDYPSKSNDSIDGVTGREAMPNLHDVSSKEKLLNEPNRDFFASDVKTSQGLGIQKQGVEVTEGMTTQSTINDFPIGNKSVVCTESAGTRRADLEATLRQKALENLLKRRGKLSAKISGDEKGGYDIGVKEPSIVNAQHMHHHEETIDSVENVGKGDEHMPHDDGNIKCVQKVGKVFDDKHMACSDGNIRTEQKVGRGVDVVYTTTLPSQFVRKTEPSKHSDPHLLNMNVETPRLADKGKVSSNVVNGRPNASLSMPRKEFLGGKNTWKRQLIPQLDCQENLSTPRKILMNKDTTKQFASLEVTEPTVSTLQETISKKSIGDSSSQQFDSELNTEKVEADGRSDPSPFGGQNMNDKKNETNEENQFQQKTMSVMRGGEMVQVSYKVYIPTKTPALARRKLKR